MYTDALHNIDNTTKTHNITSQHSHVAAINAKIDTRNTRIRNINHNTNAICTHVPRDL